MGQIENLRTFITVIDNGGISKAAEKMHIAKSAISRRLNLLEERYGNRLIDRSPGNWEVTATGNELYQRAMRVVGEADEIESDFTESSQKIEGPLRISIPREFGVSFLKDALMDFKKRYNEIALSVDFDDHVVDISRDNYDFAIRITPQLGDSVIGKQIGSTRHILSASPDYLEQFGEPQSLDDLKEHALLNFGSQRRARWEFQEVSGKSCALEFQPALNSNSGLFLTDAAKNGMGIVRLPDFLCQNCVENGELIPILPQMRVEVWGIFLVHSEQRRLNRRMRLFSEAMEAACLPKQEA